MPAVRSKGGCGSKSLKKKCLFPLWFLARPSARYSTSNVSSAPFNRYGPQTAQRWSPLPANPSVPVHSLSPTERLLLPCPPSLSTYTLHCVLLCQSVVSLLLLSFSHFHYFTGNSHSLWLTCIISGDKKTNYINVNCKLYKCGIASFPG